MKPENHCFYRCTKCAAEYQPDQIGMCTPCLEFMEAGTFDQVPSMHQIEEQNRARGHYQYLPVRWISRTEVGVWPWDDADSPLSFTMGPADAFPGETKLLLTAKLDSEPLPPLKNALNRRKGRELTQ